jgi:DNA helicase II / ATP-dependent DNA helicase PcrA
VLIEECFMDMSLRLAAVQAARTLFLRFREAHPDRVDDQMPLDELASWLGCEIATFHPDDHPGGTYGFLEPGEQLIWLCRDLSVTLRRFTLAHELGHVILHSHIPTGHDLPVSAWSRSPWLPEASSASAEDPCQMQDISEELDGLASGSQAEDLLGPGAAYDPRSQRELAANLFAAELLMPLERVWELYVLEQATPERLATLFNVSQAAILNRLAGLLTERPATLVSPVDITNELVGKDQTVKQTQISSKKSYDQFQQAAIEATTPALIVAGPGSGKTSTLIGRAEYLLHEQSVDPERILALTFSRKAAQEMQERLQQALPAGMHPPKISTFHAFCAELLRAHSQRAGLRPEFALLDDAEGYFLLHQIGADLPLRHFQNLHNPAAPFRDFLKAISRAKDELVTPERYRELAMQMSKHALDEDAQEVAECTLEIATVYERYQQALEERGDSDFGGLLMLAVQLLSEHADIRSQMEQRYQHILVDEFQDINRASGVLLRLLAGEQRRVWVVGDANQAIYGFRGASPANIANFHHDYPDATVLPLSRNYRSRPDIVHLADTFRRGILEQHVEDGAVQTARASQPDAYITLAVASDEASELRGLVRDIQHKLSEGYRCREIVVLCRTRAMVRKVTHALALAELPVSERSGIFEQEHTKNLLSLLLLIADPSGMGLLRATRLPAHPLEQADREVLLLESHAQKTTVLSLILRGDLPLNMSAPGARSLTQLGVIIKNLLHGSNSVWSLLARYLLVETTQVRDLLTAGENPQARRMSEDYASLLQFAHTYDQQQRNARRQAEEWASERNEEPPDAPDLTTRIHGFLEYFQVLLSLRQENEGKRESEGEDAEDVPEILRVMTVHASKGLEFPVVYLPGLTQGRFPLRKRYNPMPPPVNMLAPESEGEGAHESGEACLFYVGTTRARDQLILSYSERSGKQSAKRSGYIDALIVGLPDERVRREAWLPDQAAALRESAVVEEPVPMSRPGAAFIQAMQPARPRSGAIDDYQTCPRRYAYSTIYAFRRNEGAFLPFWQATSDTLKALSERLGTEEGSVTQEQVAELFHQHWQEHGGHEKPFAQLYERHGQEISEQVRRKLLEEQAGNWKLRQSMTVDLGGWSIEVTIDRVENGEDGQPAKFVRTRFGRSKGKPTAGPRELLYLHARRQHHAGQEIALETHNLSTGETHEIKITARKEQSLIADLTEALEGIERQDYTPRPDAFVCPTCPYFLICPA